MKFLGLEIKLASKDDRLGRAMMPTWTAGLEHITPENYQAMVKAYRSWVYVCANKNALTVAQQNLKLYVAKPSKTTKLLQPTKAISKQRKKYLKSLHTVNNLKSVRQAEDIEEVIEHPFLDILQNVNPFTNQFDLWELSTVYQELVGNAYWYIIRNEMGLPEEIWVLPSQYMTVVPDKENFIKGYILTNGTQKIPFDVDEIVHFKYANPNDLYYGMAPLAAVVDAYNTNQNIAEFTNALFTNMARPEGVLETEQDLFSDDFDRLKKEWNAAYGGVSKAKKTAVLAKGLSYKPITMTPQELDYIEGRQVVKEEICNAYGQNIALYSQSANRANSEQAYRAFLRDTITPKLRRYEQKINETVMPMYDNSLFVAFENAVPEDVVLKLKERESNLKTGFSSINQERIQDGLEPVDWGNVPLLPMNTVPLGSAPPKEQNEPSKFFMRELAKGLKK